jgi:thioredoxin-like negative regulator of GroEL
MNPEIITRLVWAIGIVLFGIALYKLTNRAVLEHAAAQAPVSQSGTPSILYFTTPDCSPCKTIQRPAIQRVQQTVGERIVVVEVNAYEQPELARQWGVLSVPTTFILDSSGKPLHINHGVTQAEKLLKQLQAVL